MSVSECGAVTPNYIDIPETNKIKSSKYKIYLRGRMAKIISTVVATSYKILQNIYFVTK